ncbi:hypothetical protein TRVL_08314 [Trypanosoma vivax]|nr:hypothetical protein TRVL_08314 [Trypanosoma vivax]
MVVRVAFHKEEEGTVCDASGWRARDGMLWHMESGWRADDVPRGASRNVPSSFLTLAVKNGVDSGRLDPNGAAPLFRRRTKATPTKGGPEPRTHICTSYYIARG